MLQKTYPAVDFSLVIVHSLVQILKMLMASLTANA